MLHPRLGNTSSSHCQNLGFRAIQTSPVSYWARLVQRVAAGAAEVAAGLV